MNGRVLRIIALWVILAYLGLILAVGICTKPNLWMLEISEETARAYNQLCVVDNGHLYSLSGWVPSPKFRGRLCTAGVKVADYAVIYQQESYERVVACTQVPIPVVTDDANLIHYYFTDESLVYFYKASYAGMKGGLPVYDIDTSFAYLYTAPVGPEGYSVYDLSNLEDGLYYANPGGLVEFKRSVESKRLGYVGSFAKK